MGLTAIPISIGEVSFNDKHANLVPFLRWGARQKEVEHTVSLIRGSGVSKYDVPKREFGFGSLAEEKTPVEVYVFPVEIGGLKQHTPFIQLDPTDKDSFSRTAASPVLIPLEELPVLNGWSLSHLVDEVSHSRFRTEGVRNVMEKKSEGGYTYMRYWFEPHFSHEPGINIEGWRARFQYSLRSVDNNADEFVELEVPIDFRDNADHSRGLHVSSFLRDHAKARFGRRALGGNEASDILFEYAYHNSSGAAADTGYGFECKSPEYSRGFTPELIARLAEMRLAKDQLFTREAVALADLLPNFAGKPIVDLDKTTLAIMKAFAGDNPEDLVGFSKIFFKK